MPFIRLLFARTRRLATALPLLLAPALLHAQAPAAMAAACSSDAQPAPGVLVERFLTDDCTDCWTRATRPADRTAFVIDWILPGRQGNAALAAAALPESARRLAALGYSRSPPEPQFWKWRHPDPGSALPGHLRVAHGSAVNDYVGVSIGWAPSGADRHHHHLNAWLALVEELPAGTAGSTSPRRLVRAAFSLDPVPADRGGWTERRSMRVPQGADPARMRVVGWLADSRGRVLASAASRCPP